MRVDQKKDGQVQHGHPQIWLSTRVFWNVEILGPHPRTIRTSADGKFLLKVEENMFQWLISLMGEWKGPAKKNIIYHHLPSFTHLQQIHGTSNTLGSSWICYDQCLETEYLCLPISSRDQSEVGRFLCYRRIWRFWKQLWTSEMLPAPQWMSWGGPL